MGDLSSFLFAKPSVVEGAARIFDFAGALNQYNSTLTERGADLRALQADWQAVGGDIQEAIRLEQETLDRRSDSQETS